ncbi:MAG: hypothetical protein HRT35_32720 [Algicola sp.]|nr:hypothetical protein [Algicola sp.]
MNDPQKPTFSHDVQFSDYYNQLSSAMRINYPHPNAIKPRLGAKLMILVGKCGRINIYALFMEKTDTIPISKIIKMQEKNVKNPSYGKLA